MNISIAAKFALTISAIGMLASTALGWYSYSSTREVLQSEIRHKLEAVRENKGKDVLEDLRDNLNRAAVFSAEPEATEALALLMAHARAGGVSRDGSFDVTSAEYERIFRKIMPPILSRMAITRSLRDIFLVSADNGQVMFSIARGRDLGTNLRAGPYRSSALARTWERVIATGRPYLADFSLYEPAGMACLFVGAPVFDEQQRVSAVVIEQFSSERLTEILQQEAGFGASGEVFLIGEDKLIRTKLRNLPDASVLVKKIDTQIVRDLLAGHPDTRSYLDYRAVPAIVSGAFLGLKEQLGADFDWGIVAKMDEAEAFAPMGAIFLRFVAIVIGVVVLAFIVGILSGKRVARGIVELTGIASAIAGGNLETPVVVSNKDEVGQLARTIGKMQVNLRETVATNRRSDWLKTGLVRLNDALRGEQDRARLATLAITEICSYLDALVGVLFVMQEEGSDAGALTLLGSFAHTERTSVATRFLPGEGLVGQAALERRQILISQPPADYIRVVSGLGETPPGRICVTPFLFEDRVRGVVEIGSLGELDALGLDYLRQAAQVLGISFETAQGRLRLARELERTKSMTSELQVQQEELRVSNEELQEKNELLTRQKREVDGARKAIAEKVEELTRSGKYKSEFLANMSHELRTPLNSLLLLAGGLADNRENNLSPDQLESARIIQASGNDLLSLINEILDLAKIESGQMKLELSKISLKTFVDAIDESFGQMAREQGLALNLEIGSDLPADFETDPRRLLQVLKNLISNALKFTEAGSVTLRMHRPEPGTDLAWSGLDPGSAIAISVLDTGIGIAPENQTLVFEAFQQVDGGSARKYLGTGLGLSISRELVQLLGGEIQLASELGRGSVFTLYLPLKAPRAGEPPTREPSERQEGKLSDDRGAIGRAKRLLVVGDDEGTRRHLVELLKGKEVLVDEAGSSEEAKTAIARERYDCVILDLDLWDMDGADFLGSLAREQGGELPALIIHTARELTREEESRLREYTESIVLRNVRSDERLLDEVSLFLHRAERDMPAPQQRIIAELKGSNSGLKGKRILLADDDMRSAFALSKLLTGRGLEVIKAENGEKALMVLAEDPSIDLVLMDVMMPVMDGYEAIRRIRAEERFARLPLIALTAKAMAGDRDACLAAGASDYQTKPIDPDRLISMIRVWLAT